MIPGAFEVGKFALDVFIAVRDVLKEKRATDAKLIKPAVLFKLRACLNGLQQAAVELADGIEATDHVAVENAWDRFGHLLWEFVELIQGVNLAVLDVYYPGLGVSLAKASGYDSLVFGALQESTGRYGDIPDQEISKQQKRLSGLIQEFERSGVLVRARTEGQLTHLLAGAVPRGFSKKDEKMLETDSRCTALSEALTSGGTRLPGADSREKTITEFRTLADALATCAEQLETILKENWKPADLS